MQPLPTFHFPTDELRLTPLMKQEDALLAIRAGSRDVVPQKVLDIYGEVCFPEPCDARPYTFASIVLSSDGKMAFTDDPKGPLIAQNNALDPMGGKTDFWVLNMLRMYADAVILGARTLQAEPEATAHVFCEELARARLEVLKKGRHPLNCVVSFDGTDIPLGHRIFAGDLPVAIGTSPDGGAYLCGKLEAPHAVIGPYRSAADVDVRAVRQTLADTAPGATKLILTGMDGRPDSGALLLILRALGVKKLCVESPSYMWHLVQTRAMDEIFITYSMLFAGGPIAMGAASPFSSLDHPHADLLSVSMHRTGFLFTRQRVCY